MKPITDPDELYRKRDIEYDTENLVIYIRSGGAIDEVAGLTGQVLYVFTMEEWKCPQEGMEDLMRHEFPFEVRGGVDQIVEIRMRCGWTIDPHGLHLLRRTFLKDEYREDVDMYSPHGSCATYAFVSEDMRAIQFYD